MATNIYVWSGATGANNGTDWNNAFTSYLTAFASYGSSRNYNLILAHDHFEEIGPGQQISEGYGHSNDTWVNISVNRFGAFPPTQADYLPGATFRFTNSSPAFGNWVVYQGITFQLGYNVSVDSSLYIQGFGRVTEMRDCLLDLSYYTGNSYAVGGVGNGGTWYLYNTKIKLPNATPTAFIDLGTTANMYWDNQGDTIFAPGSAIPTWLFRFSETSNVEIANSDLTQIVSPKRLFETSGGGRRWTVRNCKLSDSFIMHDNARIGAESNGSHGVAPGFYAEVVNCTTTSGKIINDHYENRSSIHKWFEVYRDGGAVDAANVPYSWAFIPNYYAGYHSLGQSPNGILYNSVVGSPRTLTVEFLSQQLQLHDQQVMLEVEYLGESNSLVGTTAYSNGDQRAIDIDTPSTLPSSTATWTKIAPFDTSITATPQKVSVTFTPQRAGPIRWRINAGHHIQWYPDNYMIFVDPVATLS